VFETIFDQKAAIQRHRTGPLRVERERYLRHCAGQGASPSTQRKRAKCLLWVARRLLPKDHVGVDAERFQAILRQQPQPGPSMALVILELARPWLKFLGWWLVEEEPIPFREHLDGYITWMRRERGLSPKTIYVRSRAIAGFLRWCGKSGRDIATLKPTDVDAYFTTCGPQWSRISAASTASRLRVFLRYAASVGACPKNLAEAIFSPRIYQLESLPYAMSWSDVRKLLASAGSGSPGGHLRFPHLWLPEMPPPRRGSES
jgi:hypothetical protein